MSTNAVIVSYILLNPANSFMQGKTQQWLCLTSSQSVRGDCLWKLSFTKPPINGAWHAVSHLCAGRKSSDNVHTWLRTAIIWLMLPIAAAGPAGHGCCCSLRDPGRELILLDGANTQLHACFAVLPRQHLQGRQTWRQYAY
jgi:hypothetical protein